MHSQEGQQASMKTVAIHLCRGKNIAENRMVGDPGIEPGVRLREGVTVPCHTLRPVAHLRLRIALNVRA